MVRLPSLTLDKDVADSSTFHKVSKKYLPLYYYNNRSNPDLFGRGYSAVLRRQQRSRRSQARKKHNAAASR